MTWLPDQSHHHRAGNELTQAISTQYATLPVEAVSCFFVGMGASGSIALAALVYPTALRSTGIGWAMEMGRAGQVIATLVIGLMVGFGWHSKEVFLALGLAPLLGAISVMAMRWHTSRLPAAEAVA